MQLGAGMHMAPEVKMAATPALVAYATMLALPGSGPPGLPPGTD